MSRPPRAPTRKSEGVIFAEALACTDPAERRRLLDSECGDDTVLRDAVSALLEESAGMGDFLERPAVSDTTVGALGSGLGSPASHHVGENLGDHLGPYQLVDLIGEGGGGTVYLARQERPVQRTVALKILKLGMDTRSVIARFEAERQTLTLMEHPNIARVLDAGATKEGRPYFVMDYVPGAPLTDYCDANKLTVEERIAIFIKVCRAVEHAHQKGIIHRDLKPSNILVAEQDGEIVPKIIDFGVAKLIDPDSSPYGQLTQVDTIIGTPAYMSPEQVERERGGVDTRSDVYALGVLLHELLTGYTPLSAKGVGKTSIVEVREYLRKPDTMRPSARLQAAPLEGRPAIEFDRSTTIDRLVAKLRGDLDWVVMKCLERDRVRRFGSASDLARDLERYLEGDPVTARPPSTSYRLGKLVRRHRSAVVTGCVLLLMLLGAVAVSVTLAVRAKRAEGEMREAHRTQSEMRVEADRDREGALRSAEAAHLYEYVADINLSHNALLEGHYGKAMHHLNRHAPREAGERDLRGFEWRYLAGRFRGDPHRSLFHLKESINHVVFSPRGDVLAIATGGEVVIWSLREDRSVATIPVGASTVAIFPDGGRIVTAGRSAVQVFDLATGEAVWEMRGRDAAMALSRDGRFLATSGRRGVTIWETAGGQRERFLSGASGPLAFSPDGERIATGSGDGLAVWSLRDASRQVLEESPGGGRGLFPGARSLTFSADGAYVLVAQNFRPTRDGYSMGIWDAESGREVSMLPQSAGQRGHAGIVSAASFDASGELLATSSWDHSLRLWDFESRTALRSLHGHRGEVWCVAVSPNGKLVASGSKDGEVMLWPSEAPEGGDSIAGKWKPLGYSNDGSYLAAHNREGMLSIFNLHTREAVHSVELATANTFAARDAISLSHDLKIVAEGRPDGSVRIRNLEDGTERSVRVGGGWIESVLLSPAAETLVTRTRREGVAWWDLAHPEEPIARVEAVHAVFSADGSTLATVSREGEAITWDAATRLERNRFGLGEQPFGSRLVISPDGRVLAVNGGSRNFENTIQLWDTTSGKLLGSLTGHKQSIWSLAFSADGRTLASSSGGGTLRMWNVESRRELLTIQETGSNLTDLMFSPDGQYLVGASPSFASEARMRVFVAPAVDARWLDSGGTP